MIFIKRSLLFFGIIFLTEASWSQSIHFDDSMKSVGKIYSSLRPDGPSCSGTLIHPKIVLTNLHCLGDGNGFYKNIEFETNSGERSAVVDMTYPHMPMSINGVWQLEDAYLKDYAFAVLKNELSIPYAEMDMEFVATKSSDLISYGFPNLQYKVSLMFSSSCKPWPDHPKHQELDPAYFVLKCMMVNGMSGGGLFEIREPGKKLVLVGVNQGGGVTEDGRLGGVALQISLLPEFKELFALAKEKVK